MDCSAAREPADTVRFGLLGPLLVVDAAGRVAVLGAAKQRTILAALLVSANATVSADRLTEILWDGCPPPCAATAVRNYVMRLRRRVGSAGARIVARPAGYAVEVRGPAEFDVAEADRLRRDARVAAEAGRWPEASTLLSTALGLWRGEPLADIPSPVLTQLEIPHLAELRLQLTEARIDADLRLARHAELVAELRQLAAEHPLREHVRAQLMLAFYRCGRQAEALEAYRNTRATLAEELGVEPGPELQELHQRMLGADARLMAVGTWRPASPALAASQGRVIPRQLPAGIRCFIGRAAELRALDDLLGDATGTAGAAVISAIGGTPGVGKTALAVHWAHQVAERFPDGQLYVNLRGYDPGEPVCAPDVLAGFLRALGVPWQDVPAEADERGARFRSLLAGRRMLVVLDNAAHSEQVRPLLPGSSECVTLVTSRDALPGLVAGNGALRLDLDLLTPAESVGLLRALVGARVDAEPDAAVELAGLCARLPLSLRVAAEFAAARPAASLAELARELADQQRLDLLDVGGDPRTGIRAVFSWSYRHLDTGAARLFRLLGLHPGPDLDPYAAAALAAATVPHVRGMLNVLARAHLVQPSGSGRHGMHDLLRAYARELTSRDREDERREALTSLFDYYLNTAGAAMNTLFPAERHRRPRIPPPATATPPLAEAAEAKAWLAAELTNLVAVTAYTADCGWPGHATRLSATVARYLAGGGHLPEAVVIHSYALGAARAIGDPAAEATTLSSLSQIDLHYGYGEQATCQLRQAMALFREAGDRTGEARVLNNLATVEAQEGRYQQAGKHHQQALELYLAVGDQTGEARALHGLSDVDLRLGRYQRAHDHLGRALALCQQTGDWVNEAYVLSLLGDLNLRLRRYPHAAGHLTRALGLFREADDRIGEAWVLAHLGAAQLGQGHGELAIEYDQEAQAVARENKDQFGEAEALNSLGEAYLATSQPVDARTAHTRALHLATQTGDNYEQARAHVGLAHSYQAADDPAQAIDHWRKALALYDDLGTPEAGQIRAHLAVGNH
jgi:DNA-binding SARP family transcriptional activator/tetratricopeptide (TPR) repeat protein